METELSPEESDFLSEIWKRCRAAIDTSRNKRQATVLLLYRSAGLFRELTMARIPPWVGGGSYLPRRSGPPNFPPRRRGGES
jgi:hypothetical protein